MQDPFFDLPGVAVATAPRLKGMPTLTVEGYHQHPAISSSALKCAATGTPRRYWAKYIDPDRKPFRPTEAMQQCSLVDCFVTRPDSTSKLYAVVPADAPRRPTEKQLQDGADSRAGSKAHDAWLAAQDRQAWWDAFDKETAGCELVPVDWWARAEAIRDVLHSHPEIGPRLRDTTEHSQSPHFWHDESLGVACRYLPDLETAGMELWDLKKARSCNPRLLRAQSFSLGYGIQLSHYSAGFASRYGQQPVVTGLIAYEWEWPHETIMLRAPAETLAHGEQSRRDAWAMVKECTAKGCWPSYESTTLDLPGWLKAGEAQPDAEPDDITLF